MKPVTYWGPFSRSNPLPMSIDAQSLGLLFDVSVEEAEEKLRESEGGALMWLMRQPITPEYDATIQLVLFHRHVTWATGQPIYHDQQKAKGQRRKRAR